jgi:tetratricopeptide (TPR) repeat protein
VDTGGLALDALELMVDNSLVRRIDTDAGTSRFRMLETIREFALECLGRSGEEEDLHERHARYFLEFVGTRAPKFTVEPEVLPEMESEHGNIRTALRWAIDSGSADIALPMGTALWRFWQLRGHLAEGRRSLSEILRMPAAADPTVERARAVMALGSVTYWQNDFAETRRRYEEALEMFRAGSDEQGLQEALYNSGFLWLLERDPEPAKPVFEESLSLARQRGDELGQANASWGLAMAAVQARDWDEALRWGQDCTRLYDEVGDRFGQGLAIFVRFQVARYTGRFDEARGLMRQYAETATRADSERMLAVELVAEIDLVDGHVERGLRIAGAAAAFREEYGGGSPPPLTELSDAREVARRTLDEDRVEELWAEGYALSRAEAAALAFGSE